MQNQRIRYLLMVSAGGLIGLLSVVRVTHAETIIDDGYLRSVTTWTMSGSPYIVEDPIVVPKGVALNIDPGVKVIGGSSVDGYNLIYVEGVLNINGKPDNHVLVSGFGSIGIYNNGFAKIAHGDISVPLGTNVINGKLELQNSAISGADIGLLVRSSAVSILDSKIIENNRGIVVQDSSSGGIFPVFNDNENGMGGMGNESSDQSLDEPSSVSITNSSLVSNSVSAIENNDSSYVQAKQNWWGSELGPSMFSTNKITGFVNYAPWLDKDPYLPETDPSCCSSILFIPGLQGTRLYKDEKAIIGSSTNQLWEPNRNADVEKLYLNEFGSSTLSGIYSSDIIGKAYGFKDIYGKFESYLDFLKDNNKIKEWKAFGYDWRMPITEVVAGKNKSLVDIVSDLASSSNTGKVSIVAHSNGGLVTKYLVKVLEDQGKSGLIDKIVSVAVPYIGTPEAVFGLLHGYEQSIIGGTLLKESTARNLGKNMSSAYSLLPSRSYFSKTLLPTIAFASTTVKDINNGSYPKEIKSYEDQLAFIGDTKNIRTSPSVSDTSLPIKGNNNLLLASDILHGILDPYSWPVTISKWAIVGWNKGTGSSLVYSNDCKKDKCSPNFKVEDTLMGDGTVVLESATYNSGEVLSVDLEKFSKQEDRDIAHANILGASSTIAVVDRILQNKEDIKDQSLLDDIAKIPGVTIGKPNLISEPISLVLSTHSPVDLHVYDKKGRHIGFAPLPEQLAGQIEDDVMVFYDNDILGGSMSRIMESDGTYKTYISLPDDDGNKYDVFINGNDFGTFSYVVERNSGAKTLDRVEYRDIPVTPLSVASTTISARDNEDASLPRLDLLPPLKLDLDGNGSVDIVATSGSNFANTNVVDIDMLRKFVSSLSISKAQMKVILKRIDNLEKTLNKGKNKKIMDRVDRLNKYVGHIKAKNMSATDKEMVLKMLEEYISEFE